MNKKVLIAIMLVMALMLGGCAGYSEGRRYNPNPYHDGYYHFPYGFHGYPFGYRGYGYGGWPNW